MPLWPVVVKEILTQRFIVDMTLGKLARWLRILGFDTVVIGEISAAGGESCEGRFLLSRNRVLDRWARGQPHLVVRSHRVADQLREVFSALKILPENLCSPPRCSLCNAELVRVDRRMVRFLVADYVYRHATRFGRCPCCGRLYWPGTHRRQMAIFVDRFFPHPMTS